MDKVFIIIVNYTKYKDTIECLESVFKSTYANFQVILIDNSPDDLSETNILKWLNGQGANQIETDYTELVYPLIKKPVDYLHITEDDIDKSADAKSEKLIFVKAENRGFAAANNIGLKYILKCTAEPSFIWILNNDTVVEKNCLRNLLGFFDDHELKYVIGSKLRFYHHKQTLQAVAGRYNKWLGSTYHIGEGETDNGQYDDFLVSSDNYIIGASMFLPKQFLNKVGVMDEDYFLYYEEMDWILRGSAHGFKIAIQPTAIVYHKEGSTIRGEEKKSSFSDYYSITNRLRFTKKWYPVCLYTVTLGVIYALVKRLMQGKIDFVKKTTVSVLKILF